MLNFTLGQPIQTLYGVGITGQIGELLKTAGYEKPLIVCDQGVKASGIVDRVLAGLKAEGISCVLFDKVLSDPPLSLVEEGYELAVAEKVDAVVAVGGGSSIDTAKGINVLRHNPGPLLQYADPANVMKKCLGLIAIPTTAGTGSELSNGLVITAPAGDKILMLNPATYAEYVIIDPENYVGMPPSLTIFTGLDVLAHACESHMTLLSNLATSVISEKVISLVVEWLPIAVQDGRNMEARSYMAVAASLGGWCLNMAGALAGHSFAHVMGARLHLPHGAACAYALPWVLAFNASLVPEKVKRVARLMGAEIGDGDSPEQIGAKAKERALKFIFDEVGLPPISTFKPDKGKIDEVAEAISVEICMSLNPEPMPLDVIKKTLKQILNG